MAVPYLMLSWPTAVTNAGCLASVAAATRTIRGCRGTWSDKGIWRRRLAETWSLRTGWGLPDGVAWEAAP